MIRGVMFALAVLLGGSLEAQQPKHAKLIGRIDSVARKAMADGPIPGLSIAVARGKETLVAKGYGYASLADSAAATAETVYPIASITKQFTAAAIMQLAEKNKLKVRDELAKVLPDFPAQDQKVTIQHLLNHT